MFILMHIFCFPRNSFEISQFVVMSRCMQTVMAFPSCFCFIAHNGMEQHNILSIYLCVYVQRCEFFLRLQIGPVREREKDCAAHKVHPFSPIWNSEITALRQITMLLLLLLLFAGLISHSDSVHPFSTNYQC